MVVSAGAGAVMASKASKGKGKGKTGRKLARMKRAEVAGLALFRALCDRAEDMSAAVLLADVHTAQGRDRRRLFGKRVRASVRAEAGGRCFYCGVVVADGAGHVDHVIPWARGGRTTARNAAWTCAPCNTSKGGRVW